MARAESWEEMLFNLEAQVHALFGLEDTRRTEVAALRTNLLQLNQRLSLQTMRLVRVERLLRRIIRLHGYPE